VDREKYTQYTTCPTLKGTKKKVTDTRNKSQDKGGRRWKYFPGITRAGIRGKKNARMRLE